MLVFMRLMETFIDWVRNELRLRGWLQEDIVKRGGISSGAISKVMSGERNPGPEFCRAIARAGSSPALLA
jgi:transcriptional regulator with XRE-family HTH domain